MTSPSPGMAQNAAGSTGMNSGGFMSGGFGRGLLGGLVGAGLFGMLFGNGFGGGLGGLSSILGLVLRSGFYSSCLSSSWASCAARQPARQGAAYDSGAAKAAPRFRRFRRLKRRDGETCGARNRTADFNVFEQRLGLMQKAYGAEDMAALRALATPKWPHISPRRSKRPQKKGEVDKISDVTLLQGDLEAWREPESDYASVAMRFSLIDTMVDRATGKVVSGDPVTPEVSTEIWTFARRPGGAATDWKLSAIQQA